ncbi:MAG: dephospho-CoA kinase [Pseudomonadota bacterium]|nr:dephospho-CoA kinase [Pseudomonadota bacterium]MEC7250596.1 dephospho-CoA kinase [Pseudomonadota bacterium]MEC7968728.1 dephospho-CoA kinase [Pseudomonadota bacterium]MEC7974254.1 dephospho-CoA kinase [Pseudomonadota bacterium]MEC7990187.1 dephospho-CoA kinase [Pseudomonadota bacterium]
MIIGLTGGIASGKSTVATTLQSWGAYVIDADKLGHRAYVKGTDAFHKVVAQFGEDIVGADGEVDRRALGAKVFGEGGSLKQLTDIVWPAIYDMAAAEIKQSLDSNPNTVVVLEAAVLIEAGWQSLVDEIWVTTVDPSTAIERASARDGVDADAVQARIDAQLSNAERTAEAAVVIDNSADEPQLLAQLENHWKNLQERCS